MSTMFAGLIALLILLTAGAPLSSAQAQDSQGPGSNQAYLKILTKQITPQQQENLAGLILKLQNNPDDVDSLIRVGVLFMDVARAHRNNHIVWLMLAHKELSRAVRLDPQNFYAHHNYGQALYMAGDLRPMIRPFFSQYDSRLAGQPVMELSVKEFTRALEINPDSARTYMGRGFAYLVLNREAQARPDLNKAARLDPSLQSGMDAEVKGIAAMKGQSQRDSQGIADMLREMSKYSVIAGVHDKRTCDGQGGYWMDNECRIKGILP